MLCGHIIWGSFLVLSFRRLVSSLRSKRSKSTPQPQQTQKVVVLVVVVVVVVVVEDERVMRIEESEKDERGNRTAKGWSPVHSPGLPEAGPPFTCPWPQRRTRQKDKAKGQGINPPTNPVREWDTINGDQRRSTPGVFFYDAT